MGHICLCCVSVRCLQGSADCAVPRALAATWKVGLTLLLWEARKIAMCAVCRSTPWIWLWRMAPC